MEIKGLQELDLVPLVVEYEVQRQINLIRITEELDRAAVKQENLKEEFFDVSPVFKQTKCKVIRKALDAHQEVLAVKLAKFRGFLKRELMPGFRLGTEMADRARFWGRVGGIFHTDEMPAYGITSEEVEELRKTVKAEAEDAVVFVADKAENTRDALKAVVERAKEALKGVPAETRAPNADGTTRYMRPRPGAARMYPETDIPPIQITEDYVRKISLRLPELPEGKLERLTKAYRLNQKLAKQILDSEYGELFETIVNESEVSPTMIAAFMTETAKALKRDGVPVEKVSDNQIREVFRAVGSGKLTKEAVSEIISWLSRHEDNSVDDAINRIGLKMLSNKELGEIVDAVIERNRTLILEKKENAFGPLIGVVMKEVRGKAVAALVSELVKQKLESACKK
jgi:glutamyl-tRNA(Gln) amidotransferase subunit E